MRPTAAADFGALATSHPQLCPVLRAAGPGSLRASGGVQVFFAKISKTLSSQLDTLRKSQCSSREKAGTPLFFAKKLRLKASLAQVLAAAAVPKAKV